MKTLNLTLYEMRAPMGVDISFFVKTENKEQNKRIIEKLQTETNMFLNLREFDDKYSESLQGITGVSVSCFARYIEFGYSGEVFRPINIPYATLAINKILEVAENAKIYYGNDLQDNPLYASNLGEFETLLNYYKLIDDVFMKDVKFKNEFYKDSFL